jgi:hypothetical protein
MDELYLIMGKFIKVQNDFGQKVKQGFSSFNDLYFNLTVNDKWFCICFFYRKTDKIQ